MKIFKKLAVKALSLAAAAVMALSAGVNASAIVINYKWSYDVSAPKQEDHIGRGGKNARFSVDDKVHTDSSWFSIKLEMIPQLILPCKTAYITASARVRRGFPMLNLKKWS